MTTWTGRRVVLGVSGGIACYKSCILARRLVEGGALVDAVLTHAATEFVRPLTFEALTGRPVHSSIWERGAALSHLQLGKEADLIVVAPATANLIARMAGGVADDLLTALLLAATAPVLLAPAMNDDMFAHDQTVANLDRLRSRNIAIVGPEIGALAEGPSDRPGRMSEPETILAHATRLLRRGGRLAGRRVVVTAGPTRESIDPVRVVTNRSSGKMGYAVAEVAWSRGANVVLISGPVSLAAAGRREGAQDRDDETTRGRGARRAGGRRCTRHGRGTGRLSAEHAERPQAVTHRRGDGDLHGADGRHPRRHPGGASARERHRRLCARDRRCLAKGRAKLERKALDLIVVNDALEPGAGFEVDTNRVALVGRNGAARILPLQSKHDVAEAILDAVEETLG